MLFSRNIINTISPDFSPIWLFCIEGRLCPNSACYVMNEISYVSRLKISSRILTPKNRSPSCNILWNFESKALLMKLRNLSQSLHIGPWVFWNWLRDFEYLKLASGCLQSLRVRKSLQQQQQLDKELWGCFFFCCEKILPSVVMILSRCIQWHTQIFCHETSEHLHDDLSSCCCSLLVTKIFRTIFNSVQIPQLFWNPSRLSP